MPDHRTRTRGRGTKTVPALPSAANFERLGGSVFVSGVSGGCGMLSQAEFSDLFRGHLSSAAAVKRLRAAGLVREPDPAPAVVDNLRARLLADWRGPHVHIITLTGRCGLRCSYCSASSAASSGDMTPATARRVLDLVFSIDVPRMLLEFQGGEPLLNFEVLELIVREASSRAAASGREVRFSVVSSLAAMDERKLRFLMENRVTVCASLDGPEELHDGNRGRGSHAAAAKWLRRIGGLRGKYPGTEAPNAICTVTRAALARPEEIVDEFVAQGIRRVQLGPLDPLGRAAGGWQELGYSPEEFIAFYSRALDRMEELTFRTGKAVYEKGALNFLRETRSGRRTPQRNLDLAFRLAYNWDGGIYGSDEARMLAAGGDELFRLGTAGKDTFSDIVSSPLARVMLLSCFPELTQPACSRCAFSPCCRVSPAYNYAAQGSLWGDMASSQRCALFKGVFRLLAEGWSSPRRRRAYGKWLAEGI